MRVYILASLILLFSSVSSAADRVPRITEVMVGGASLHTRSLGTGPIAIVLHGGPDFDHRYLLPAFDEFDDLFELVYYDQRGRGRSANGVRAEDVTLASELRDLDAVRRHYGSDQAILIGHSWGTVLALEYAVRYPTDVSRLVLMNPAPASAADLELLRSHYAKKLGAEALEKQRAILKSDSYAAGDPEAVAARYRIHFRPAFAGEASYKLLTAAMESEFRRQGKEGILKARAIEDRLYLDTWSRADYNLHPKLSALRIPTLVVTGLEDFIPAGVAEHIATAIPDSTLVKIPNCGHFSYLECPTELRAALLDFMRLRREPGR
jgi:proline iminopeptidase